MASVTTYNQFVTFKGMGNPVPDGRGGQTGTEVELATRFASIKPHQVKPDDTGARETLKRQYLVECWHDPAYVPKINQTIDWNGTTLVINQWSYLDSSCMRIRLLASEQTP